MASRTAELILKISQTGKSVLGNIKAGLGQVAGAAKLAGAAMLGGITASLVAYARQEKAVKNLNSTLMINGEFTKENSKQIQDWASAVQVATGAGDELVLENFKLARSMTNSKEEAMKMTEAALDFSKGAGISMETAIRQLGMATSGSAGRLAMFAPEIKNLTKEELAAGAATDILAAKFKGMAAGELDTMSGAVEAAKGNFGDFLEVVGKQFAPVIKSVAQEVGAFFIELQSNTDVIDAITYGIQTSAKAAVGFKTAVVILGKTVSTMFGGIWDAVVRFKNLDFSGGLQAIRKATATAMRGQVAEFNKGSKQMDDIEKFFVKKRMETKSNDVEMTRQSEQNKIAIKKAAVEEEINLEQAKHDKIAEKQMAADAKKAEQKIAADEAARASELARRAALSEEDLIAEDLANQEKLAREQVFGTAMVALKNKEEFQKLNAKIKNETDANKKLALMKKKQSLIDAKLNKEERAKLTNMSKFKEFLNSKEMAGMSTTLGNLAAMQNSHNKKLAAIGRAAAIAQIIVKTSVAMMQAYSQLGPIAGTAAAVAMGAFGATQLATVKSTPMADGGIVKARPGGMLAQIGEAGQDEAVIPLDDSGGAGIGSSITIIVNGGMLGDENSAREFAIVVDEELLKLRQDNQSQAFDAVVV